MAVQLGFRFHTVRIRNVLFDGNQYIIKLGLTCHLIYSDFVVISSHKHPKSDCNLHLNPLPTGSAQTSLQLHASKGRHPASLPGNLHSYSGCCKLYCPIPNPKSIVFTSKRGWNTHLSHWRLDRMVIAFPSHTTTIIRTSLNTSLHWHRKSIRTHL